MEPSARRGAEARILAEHVAIDRTSVQAFFEGRGTGIDPQHPLTSVLYQAHNPTLAEARDRYERETVTPLLRLGLEDDVLDIGCGIGRWGTQVAPLVRSYCGVDFSASLLEEAGRQLAPFPNVTLIQSGAEGLRPESLPGRYSRIVIAGVLLYLNDEDVRRALLNAARSAAPSALLYCREPIAREVRLTLDQVWSEDLGSHYSAIYRTGDELRSLFADTLSGERFRLSLQRELYPVDSGLNNRRETVQHIFIWERP